MATNRHFSMFGRGTHSGRFIRDYAYYSLAIASWVPALIFFNGHVAEIQFINGYSMYPYLNTGFNQGLKKDVCLVKKWNPLGDLHRGMIVSFRSPNHPDVLAVKRVIALEGDKVYSRAPYPFPIVEIPAGHVWVEGDNKDGGKTLDSNYYGPIAMSLITGRVTHVLWPWSSFGSIRWWEFKGRTRVIRGQREQPPSWR